MKRYYVADTWSDGNNDFCYIITISAIEGIKVFIAYVIGEKYVIEDECTSAVENTVPLIEMFDGAYEIEAKNVFQRVQREETMPRKKEFSKAILVRLDENLYKKLFDIAEAKGLTFAEVMRQQLKRAKKPTK